LQLTSKAFQLLSSRAFTLKLRHYDTGAFDSDHPIVNLLANVARNAAEGKWRTNTSQYSTENFQLCSVARSLPSAWAAMDVISLNFGLPTKPAVNKFNRRTSIDPEFTEGVSLASMVHVLKMAKHMGYPNVQIDQHHDIRAAALAFRGTGVPVGRAPFTFTVQTKLPHFRLVRATVHCCVRLTNEPPRFCLVLIEHVSYDTMR